MKQTVRVDNTGEVFTPRSLIRHMLDRLPDSAWLDPNKRWLEPSAGDGNFLEEVYHRLVDNGHDPKHVLNNMLFSVELIDENHYALQVRLGYLQAVDNYLLPGELWEDDSMFRVSMMHELAIELNDENNPYTGKIVVVNGEERVLQQHEVYHHVNHLCGSFMDPKLAFEDRERTNLSVLPGPVVGWREDNRDVGEKITYISTLFPRSVVAAPKKQKVPKPVVEKESKPEVEKAPKEPRQPKPQGEGKGGWAVHPKHYGTGKTVRSFFDGKTWEADHDALVDDINASLKAKNKKDLFEDPRPFSSSSGLRGGDKLWKVVT